MLNVSARRTTEERTAATSSPAIARSFRRLGSAARPVRKKCSDGKADQSPGHGIKKSTASNVLILGGGMARFLKSVEIENAQRRKYRRSRAYGRRTQ